MRRMSVALLLFLLTVLQAHAGGGIHPNGQPTVGIDWECAHPAFGISDDCLKYGIEQLKSKSVSCPLERSDEGGTCYTVTDPNPKADPKEKYHCSIKMEACEGPMGTCNEGYEKRALKEERHRKLFSGNWLCYKTNNRQSIQTTDALELDHAVRVETKPTDSDP